MNFDLPETVTVGERELAIRWEYRDILTILAALSDPELNQQEKVLVSLSIFLIDYDKISAEEVPDVWKKMCWFIDGGREQQNTHGPKLMDWEQDFPYIIAPINRVIGKDVRGPERIHWWTFLSAYYEIGDCLFAQIVRIRDLKSRGKTLDKMDREWARKNADLINFKTTYTTAEEDLLKSWAGGEKNG